jgi:hypothetical protein
LASRLALSFANFSIIFPISFIRLTAAVEPLASKGKKKRLPYFIAQDAKSALTPLIGGARGSGVDVLLPERRFFSCVRFQKVLNKLDQKLS